MRKAKRTVRVLVIDSHELWQRFIPTLLLEDRRCQVVGVSSDGLDGIEKARELKPELVFADVGLPNVNGIDAASRARRVSPKSRIIFLSETSDPETVRTAFTVGALGYILKSDATTDLLAGVRAVLRGKRFVSYSLADIALAAETE
jgi:DNA-binding NarL/FixJ family response regulator